MARFPQSKCGKGSQKWIQKLINEHPEPLNSQIIMKFKLPEDEYIKWLSPLKGDCYSEYRDQEFLDLLGVKLEEKPLLGFWPRHGPQWDALGKSSSGTLFLVEAKSYQRTDFDDASQR